MSVKEVVKNEKKYELVPPDGGWGYAIWIAVIINMISMTAFVGSFGMIFNDLFIQLEMGTTSMTMMNGINAMSVAISGFTAGPILKFVSKRQLGFVAAIFLNLGSFCVAFVNSRVFFFLCLLIQNLGIGMFYNLSMSLINEYFLKRRLLSLSFTQTVPAIATLFIPQLVKICLDVYGFRGTLLLISAANMHTFIAVSLMQPVERHLKKVEVQVVEDVEMKLLTADSKSNPADVIVKSSVKEINLNKCPEKVDEKDLELDTTIEQNKSIKKIILDAIDLSLVKSFLLSSAGLGLPICGFSEMTLMLMLPQTLYSMNWTEDQVAWAISLSCFGDVVTKILFIFCSGWLLRFETQEMYLVGLFCAVITRIGMLASQNVTTILSFLTILGCSRCLVLMLMPQVIAESVRPEQFTSAMGILMLVSGCCNLTLGPIVGAIRDLTNSYPTAIYILTSCFAIVIIFWIVEICYKRNKHKRKPKIVKSNSKG